MQPAPITGAEYKAFYNDDTFFSKGMTVDDVLLIIDGVRYGDGDELNVDNIADNSIVVIESGDVFSDGLCRLHSLSNYFYSWRKARPTDVLVVEVPKGQTDAVRAAITGAGGAIL